MRKIESSFVYLLLIVGITVGTPNKTFAGDKLTNPSMFQCIKKRNVCISVHSKMGDSSKIKSLFYFENADVIVAKISNPKIHFDLKDADGYIDFSLNVIHFSNAQQSITYDID